MLQPLLVKVRASGIVTSPGYSYLTNSLLFYLAGVTRVNPVEWDLPFSRFLQSFGSDTDLVLETGTGGIAEVEKTIQRRDEIIIKTEPGAFQISFMAGHSNEPFRFRILEYAELDRFKSTIKDGWHHLDGATLRQFGRGSMDGSIWFESYKMREWLTDFGPESMSDLVLLRALYYPKRIALFPEILRRKLNPDRIPSYGDSHADRILRDTYGLLVYQSQALLLEQSGFPIPEHDFDLALKGHEVARTMLSVEAIWPRRMKTSLR